MFGKLFVFSAAYDAGEWWLVLVGVAATAISLAYYLNVVRWLYMRSGAELRPAPAGGSPPGHGARHGRGWLRRRDRRLVLRRAADPRPRRRRGRLAPVLARCRGTTGGSPRRRASAGLDFAPCRRSSLWLGHSAFRVETPAGKRIYVDPFLSGNPKTLRTNESPSDAT